MAQTDQFGKHEVLHTAHIVASMFDNFILGHAATQVDPKLTAAAQRISDALGEFYQLCAQQQEPGEASGMLHFYVSHMTPIKRARIHVAECSNCNHGQGQLGQDKTGSGATGWEGPFTFDEARATASRYKAKGFTDVAFCGTCLRSHRLR